MLRSCIKKCSTVIENSERNPGVLCVLQRKGSNWCSRGSTHKQPVCLQRPSSVTQKITGTFSEKPSNYYWNAFILLHIFVLFVRVSCRFFGNRSYCYCCLELYSQALTDAERSIQLDPGWPKGYFRKGNALMGLKVGAGHSSHGVARKTCRVPR